MKEYQTVCNSINLNYVEVQHSNGSPMLLLHGLINRWQSYTPIISDLITSNHIYALDLRGHGKSARTPEGYLLQNFIMDIHNFIVKHITKPTIIVGHSFGGILALMLAALYPELVKSLILIDTPLSLDLIKTFTKEQREHFNMFILGLRFNEMTKQFTGWSNSWIPEDLMYCDPDMLYHMVNKFDVVFDMYQPEEVVPKINCPVLLIRGNPALGSLVTDSDLSYAFNLLPDLRHIQINNAGHSPIQQNKHAVIKAIKGFI